MYHARLRGPVARIRAAPEWRQPVYAALILGMWAVLSWGPDAAGAVAAAGQSGAPRFSSAVELVEVYATVTGPAGEPVTGLRQDDFVVREGAAVQEIAVFAEGTFTLTLALGVDRSWSMAGEPLRQAKLASRQFLSLLRREDRALVMSVSAEPDVIAPLSTDRQTQLRAVEALDPWSTTALRDAIVRAIRQLDAEPGRGAVVVFSDGGDRYSVTSPGELLAAARTSRSLVYPVVIGRNPPPELLVDVAGVTGGRALHVRRPAQLAPALEAIGRELRQQYLLGYVPARQASPGWHPISVSLARPVDGRRVRARAGYAVD